MQILTATHLQLNLNFYNITARVLVLQYYFTSIDLKHRIHGINQYSEMDVNYKQYSTSILSYNFEN